MPTPSLLPELLWRAPELLRDIKGTIATLAGDVYSFSIILQELVMWGEPYDAEQAIMDVDGNSHSNQW